VLVRHRGTGGPRAVGLEAPADGLLHLVVVIDVDPHRLVIRDAVGSHVGDVAAVQPLEQVISSSRPAVIRLLHQAPPPVATRLTRSPSRVPLCRKDATADLARCAWAGVKWTSSNTTMKERPERASAPVLTEIRGRTAATSGALSGNWTASKLTRD
jgi:hypothetical protein